MSDCTCDFCKLERDYEKMREAHSKAVLQALTNGQKANMLRNALSNIATAAFHPQLSGDEVRKYLANIAMEALESVATVEPMEFSIWQNAVIDELVVCGIYRTEHDTNPRLAIKDAIDWNCKVAVDPLVSREACELINAGLERAASLVERRQTTFEPWVTANVHNESRKISKAIRELRR